MSTFQKNIKNWISLLGLLRYKRPSKGEKAIIFVTETVWERGGVETRLLEYARELRKRNILPVFVARNFKNEAYRGEICIRARYEAANYSECLMAIARYFRAQIIEFQITWEGSLKRFNIEPLIGRIRTGAVIHVNIPQLDYATLNRLDYRILVSTAMTHVDYDAFKDYTIVANAITIPSGPIWEYKGQQKALVFSRISMDKIATLVNVVRFLQSKFIPFDIVGLVQDPNALTLLLEETGVSADKIKEMNVGGMEYMSEHLDDYLFVAGVGIVLLEAASLGYPCLIASELSPRQCTFLSKESMAAGIYSNLTYKRQTPEGEANIVSDIDPCEIDNLLLRDVIASHYSMTRRIEEYLELVDI